VSRGLDGLDRGAPARRPFFSASRRRFLVAGGSSLGLIACAARGPAPILSPSFSRDPFTLGVAAGSPRADGFVIWTRLAPLPLEDPSGGGGMPAQAVEVEWVVAQDPALRRQVKRGSALAEPDWAHSLHVEIAGLPADRPYWYAFRTGDWHSAIGRARTLPVPDHPLAQLRFAFASCQHYETGYYAAYRHMVADDPDLIVHLGDYIYETSSAQPLRRHEGPEPVDLAGYRRRHACYKLDPDLRAAHAHCCWLMSWDDHEVDNDYAGLYSADPAFAGEAFARRRAAAYRAYWEHMPLPLSARPAADGGMVLHSRTRIGDLLELSLLDARQYRSDQACATPGKLGGQVVPDCAERGDTARTMLGPAQEQWLLTGLGASRSRWNVIAQSMLMAPLDQRPGAEQGWWTDGWDGYPAARGRILDALAQRQVPNPVVIGGDIHAFFANDLHREGPESVVVASEFVGSSISSTGVAHDKFLAMLPENPQVKFFDSRSRGYVLCELGPALWRSKFRAVEDVRDPLTPVRTLASFVVEAGRPGVQAA
jgi:alkaline phosphatase D